MFISQMGEREKTHGLSGLCSVTELSIVSAGIGAE
jgi:hypothetical protein